MAEDQQFEELLEYLKRTRGFDFGGYKRASLTRRFDRRMKDVGVAGPREYVDYLEVHPEEFGLLFDTILINVTGFFRDRPAWDYLAEDVVPRLLGDKPEDEDVRVWCAGCATGEEAYSVAILLAEALGDDAYRERVKIYATDVDEDALNVARHATYSADDVKDVPEPVRERYLDRTDSRYTFRSDLRRMVIFGRNDLVQDAPISRVDLLVCRNTLMYFNAEAQSHMLEGFHFALRDHGVLFLGKSEMLITHTDLFVPLELKRRVFARVPRPTLRDRYAFVARANGDDNPGPESSPDLGSVRESALDVAPVAQIVVDAEGTVLFANQQARRQLGLTRRDIGKQLQELDVSYKPAELRAGIERAQEARRPVALGRVEMLARGRDAVTFEVLITPVLRGNDFLGTSVTFDDITGQATLQEELERSKRELEIAYEELQSTVEELETTNEELQSTNEELETTNEELQSTNEELETMNEELQSTNEELETTNDELRLRGTELDRVNTFLDTILTSLGLGVVVVDHEQRVQVWNHAAEDLWGLRAGEAEGKHLLGLDFGLPVQEIKPQLLACLSGESEREEVTVTAVNRKGREMRCRVSCVPLAASDVTGAILIMEELAKG
ncbi:MAG: PAS domain S-box protein [Actinobacteria bacterium]|nr:MAG: PAS domain S-box protein [Actinomycetota bacterium]